ncbi:MAG TPA: class I SAM-dependent methyltransferase [Methanofastidiosum sp.]|nr:class I SAM-dependent methyltransferase [Methanofastidiosum sp.]
MNIKNNQKEVINFYNEESSSYDNERFSSIIGKKGDIIQKKVILKLGVPWKNKKVLEIGSGTGRFSINISKLGGLVTAFDSSMGMILVAKNKASRDFTESIDFVNGNALALPFQDNSFDICISINVINHILNYEKAIAEIHRVLKPNGIFIANFTNLYSLYFPIGILVNIRKKSIYKNVYSRWDKLSTIKIIYASLNLKIENIEGGMIFPPINNRFIFFIVSKLDSLFRYSCLSNYGPVLYIKAIKK